MKCAETFKGIPCGGTMRNGIGLLNRWAWIRYPNMPVSQVPRGHTISRCGPAVLVPVIKCDRCGASKIPEHWYMNHKV